MSAYCRAGGRRGGESRSKRQKRHTASQIIIDKIFRECLVDAIEYILVIFCLRDLRIWCGFWQIRTATFAFMCVLCEYNRKNTNVLTFTWQIWPIFFPPRACNADWTIFRLIPMPTWLYRLFPRWNWYWVVFVNADFSTRAFSGMIFLFDSRFSLHMCFNGLTFLVFVAVAPIPNSYICFLVFLDRFLPFQPQYI